MRSLIAALALGASLAAGPALAQTAPIGLVEDPCVGAPVTPPAFIAFMRGVYGVGPASAMPPAAEMAAFQKAQAEAAKRDWGNLCRYRADNRSLAARPQIVFMGDSITEGWTLAKPSLFSGGVVGRGISGQTTPQMLVRFEADVIALKPRAVHIMAGTNDIAGNTGPTTEDDVKNNVRAMTALAKARGLKVILGSIPPAVSFAWSPGLKPAPQVRALNAWLRTFASEEGAVYANYYAVLATPEGAMRPELTFDGVHPNAKGYAAMEPVARQAMVAIGVR